MYDETQPMDLPDDEGEPLDPALAAAVLEVETHVAEEGWDRPSRLFALVPTAALVAAEPDLAHAMGLDEASAEGSFTPVEQEFDPSVAVEDLLATVMWPESVIGCVVTVERLVLPPGADAELPDEPAAAQEYAAAHPDRQEVRIIAGATREGASYCALRLRAHDDDQSVVGGVDLVPELLELLHATLEGEAEEDPRR
ncbi:PPA1309 family protein [Nocardioides daejeonensis]|uniref:PPA1309 family protein n=1 Tax=Nocardioides daejeonensis TaxID=1046556 RepID=UPI001EF41F40|nr:PPA1309 family protein [Nocardioides daejeonensis]